MAQGDLTLFEEFSLDIGQNDNHDLNADTFKISWHTAIPAASLATPVWADVSANECTGGAGYTSGGETLIVDWSEAAGTATFDATGSPAASWTQNGSGPADIRASIIRNTTTVGNPLICFIDMTTDGTTPISLQDGDISWTPHVNGIFTLG